MNFHLGFLFFVSSTLLRKVPIWLCDYVKLRHSQTLSFGLAEEDEWRVIFSCQSSRTCWNVAGLSDIVQGGTEVGKEEQYKEERNWQVGPASFSLSQR
ncbi:unnamed protein product [Trifolium pratense]|uniref:Uncharacterized protein n=1 Tax=Trifolium pratense TaxID=57577 RepID=A0ACB0JWL6_TRIPR|nr:unnamed protein product [Trifolium pratense]